MNLFVPRLFLACLVLAMSCTYPRAYMRNSTWEKIRFDISHLDENGLHRGERAIDYEFCIPASSIYLNKIRSIDPDIRVMKHAKGRVGCGEHEVLCIGTTRGSDWSKRLNRTVRQEFVHRVVETHYE